MKSMMINRHLRKIILIIEIEAEEIKKDKIEGTMVAEVEVVDITETEAIMTIIFNNNNIPVI